MPSLTTRSALEKTVAKVLSQTPVTDLHTHLYPPSFGTPVPNKTGKTDPKAKGAADSIMKDREASGTVAELRQQIADLKAMVEGGFRAVETEKFTNSYLDEAVKAAA